MRKEERFWPCEEPADAGFLWVWVLDAGF